MTNLDRLGQLNGLREAGALTSEEFEQEKAKLLSPANSGNRLKLGLIAAALTALAAVAWFALLPRQGGAPKESVASSTEAAGGNSATPISLGATPSPLLAFATSAEVIGVNPSYLETKLGVPRENANGQMVFDVDGCSVTYGVSRTEVTSFETRISDTCQPVIDGVQLTPRTTYGDLQGKDWSGVFVASCLSQCGNAFDPTVDLSYPGSHATNFISVRYSADYEQTATAQELWEKAVRDSRGLGPTDMPDDFDAFSCVTGPSPDVVTALSKVKVATVRVSRDEQAC